MNAPALCLDDEEVGRLLRGDMELARTSELEQHLTVCIACRERLEQQVGDTDWWCDTESSLRRGRNTTRAVGTDEFSRDRFLELLGPTDDPNMLGRIGSYEITGLLGHGGMGAVFKGFDRSLNRFVAIKMLLPHLAASGAARKRFAREGQAVAAVVDDHVMAIHCVDEWQGIPYLVMTYSRGGTLQKRLRDNGPLEVREILRIGMQAAKGLAAAHAQGIVHRDIKPANIFLDENVERVQLMDFGLARAGDDASLTRTGTLAGTPQYMSPEQARAESVDHRSDLFSLGSVLYAMCAGHAPFRADTSYGVLRLITDKQPRPIRELNAEIPEWLCAIIEKLMSKQATERFESAEEVAELLGDCLAHVSAPLANSLPRIASNSSWLNRCTRFMSDKRILSLFSLSLFVAAVVLPWLVAAFARDELALLFFGALLVVSLFFAILSRSEYFSRVVLWTVGGILGLAAILALASVPIFLWRSQAMVAQQRDAMRAEMETIEATVRAAEAARDVPPKSSLPADTVGRSRNFIVDSDSESSTEALLESAESYWTDLSTEWNATEEDVSGEPIRIQASINREPSRGWSVFTPHGSSQLGAIQIHVQGPMKGILEHELPAQLSHAFLGRLVGAPLPRWAEMGAGRIEQSADENAKSRAVLRQVSEADEWIPLHDLLTRKDYPDNDGELATMYAQSMAVCEFLITTYGRTAFLEFAKQSQTKELNQLANEQFGIESVEEMELLFRRWARKSYSG